MSQDEQFQKKEIIVCRWL